MPIAAVTALSALRIAGDLEGKSVQVTGASGGVGRFAVELAANDGARVVAVASGTERAEGPLDLILEWVGGKSLENALALVAARGIVVVFGNSSNIEAEISFTDFVGKPGARIEAFFVYGSGEPPTFGDDLGLLADLVARGSLHPQIGFEVPWTEANDAFRALHNRQVNGKAVLVVR